MWPSERCLITIELESGNLYFVMPDLCQKSVDIVDGVDDDTTFQMNRNIIVNIFFQCPVNQRRTVKNSFNPLMFLTTSLERFV